MKTTSVTTATQRILVIHNPVAGRRRRRRLGRILKALQGDGREVRVLRTTAAGHARLLALQASDYDLVVVAGGDGTVNEVIGGLEGAAVPIAFAPLGTANVLAWELGLPRRPEDLARTILGGETRSARAGRANGQRFMLMVSAGIDAWTVEAMRLGLKRKLGALAYLSTALSVLRRFPYPTYRVTIDGITYEATTVVVTRAKHYGGPFVIAPEADMAAETFSVVLTTGRGLWSTLRLGFALGLGRVHELSNVAVIQGSRIRIEGPEGDPVQGDGDLLTRLPVDIAIDPYPVRLVLPR